MSLGFEIDVRGVTSGKALHELLAERLKFPGHYGLNWDAFWDCITDDQTPLLAVLRIRGWHALAERLPRDAAQMRQSLDELPAVRAVEVRWLKD